VKVNVDISELRIQQAWRTDREIALLEAGVRDGLLNLMSDTGRALHRSRSRLAVTDMSAIRVVLREGWSPSQVGRAIGRSIYQALAER
jgi:hypothetical protein